MQSQNIPWLTPKRIRKLTIGAMCLAGVVSTVGFSGSTPAAHASSRSAPAVHRSASR